jgi:hypothetical protein
MTVIEIPDDQAAALKARAAAQGLTLERWLEKLATEDAQASDALRRAQAANRIREIQKRVKPDPEGWTTRDYIDHGRR